MAGLRALKILLLCTEVITLADSSYGYSSNDKTTLLPHTSTNSAPPSVTTLASNSSSPRIMTTSPAISVPSVTTPTPPLTTLSETTKPVDPKAPPTPTPAKCSYNVSTIKFGFEIDLKDSPDGTYSVTFTEKGQTWFGKKIIVQHSNQTSSHPIKPLKPCAEYRHAVMFIDGTGQETPCDHIGYKTIVKTNGIKKGDVTESSCIQGHVCYKSDWDISALISASNNVPAKQCDKDPKVFCIKPGINDFCTTLTTTFTSGKCPKVPSFNFTKDIPLDFLDVSEIKKEFTTGLPVVIEPNLPPKCGLTADYTCHENGKTNELKNLTDLEPFTEYNCTGQIKKNDAATNQTFSVTVNVNCDVTTMTPDIKSTNTSIHLSWTTTSLRCKDRLTNYAKFEYYCSCDPRPKHGSGRNRTTGETCEIHGLEPYTDYDCEIKPVYDGRPVGTPVSVREKTDIGRPADINSLSVTVEDHNIIKVTCDPGKRLNFHGPDHIYVARLHPGFTGKDEKKNSVCKFEFRDLSYSTKYHLEVAAYNGKLEGNAKEQDVNTLYNDKAVIGVLILAGLVVSVAVCKLCVQRRRSGVNEDMMLEEHAIYVNMPQHR